MKKSDSVISIFILAAAIYLSGCSSEIKFPSVNYSSSNEYHAGQVVWRDLVTPDPKLAAEFIIRFLDGLLSRQELMISHTGFLKVMASR